MHTNAGMHTIRLRQPWRPQWLDTPASTQGVRLASYRRAFNCPTGLAPEQTIALAIQRQLIERPLIQQQGFQAEFNPPKVQASDAELLMESDAPASAEVVLISVALNAQPLALTQPAGYRWQADLSGALLPFNQLDIVVQLDFVDTPPPPLTDLLAVQLEIA